MASMYIVLILIVINVHKNLHNLPNHILVAEILLLLLVI